VFIAITVIAYVYLEGTAYRQPALFIIAILAVYYFGGKALSFLSRSSNRWSMTNWQGVKYANLAAPPVEDVCAAENAAYEAEMAKIKGKILDKLIAMKSRFNKLDKNKKLLTERGEKMKNDYADIIAKADTIFDKLPKDKQDLIIEAKKKAIAKEPRTPNAQPTNQNNNSNSNIPNNANSKIDQGIPRTKEEKIRSVKQYLKMAGQPINVLDNEADINEIVAQMDKLADRPNVSEIDEKNKIIANILKNKGVQDSEIKKALDELNRKLKN
jgi:hypothetical protein